MKLNELLTELRKAVNEASNVLQEKNLETLSKYFVQKKISESETVCMPKTIRMDYPVATEDGKVAIKRVDVPLISLIPVTNSKVEKATFSIDFQMDDEDGDVKVSFPKKRFGEVQHMSHLELTITPDEVPEGIVSIVSKYNSMIQNQIEE
ncbi:MAG: DUF2589 domain-containing protein [Fibrobacter sp.]|jgi:hypothetical protein|nr:DUF2589 domain-containing protein [Fibrobacter sp.]